jgi:predicted Rossmann-fold nucleotide-binding protein
MAQESCGFIGLPGGFGTFEEVTSISNVTIDPVRAHRAPFLRFWKQSLGHNWAFTPSVHQFLSSKTRFLTSGAAVVVLNVLNFWEPLRQLVQGATSRGFIQPRNSGLITFVDGPEDLSQHASFDWGSAAIKAIDGWNSNAVQPIFDWHKTVDGQKQEPLAAT